MLLTLVEKRNGLDYPYALRYTTPTAIEVTENKKENGEVLVPLRGGQGPVHVPQVTLQGHGAMGGKILEFISETNHVSIHMPNLDANC